MGLMIQLPVVANAARLLLVRLLHPLAIGRSNNYIPSIISVIVNLLIYKII